MLTLELDSRGDKPVTVAVKTTRAMRATAGATRATPCRSISSSTASW